MNFCRKAIVFSIIISNALSIMAQSVRDNSLHEKDTSLNKIFYFNAKKDSYLIKETSPTTYEYNDVHYCDQMFSPCDNFYQYLSTPGSPSQSILFSNKDILDYQYQNNTYLPYIFTRNNVKYFQNKRAYTSFSYANGLDKAQFFDINFARNIYKGLNIQTEYKVNYADGDFINSQVMNQFFNIGFNYISSNGRYKANGAFVHNRAYVLENGGIENDTLFLNNEFSSPSTYPTHLTNAWSKWKTNEFYFNQSYRLTRDSVNIFNKGAIIHSFSYERYARLYSGESASQADSIPTTLFRNSLFWTNDIHSTPASRFFMPVTLGANIDYLSFDKGINTIRNNSFLIFTPEVRVAFRKHSMIDNTLFEISYKQLFCDTKSHYQGDYQLDVSFPTLFRVWNDEDNMLINIYGKVLSQKTQADYIYLIPAASIHQTNTKSVTLGFQLKKNLNLEVSYYDLKNVFWFNNNMSSTSDVLSGDTKLLQATLKNNFKINSWGFKGLVSYQKASNEDALRLPDILLKQSVYYEFSMFKGKLISQAGIDVNYFSKYFADAYNHEYGVFVHQNDRKIGNYLYADAYFNVKIDRFTLFLALTHPYAGLFTRDYFNTPNYPHQGFSLRYGFCWKLLD